VEPARATETGRDRRADQAIQRPPDGGTGGVLVCAPNRTGRRGVSTSGACRRFTIFPDDQFDFIVCRAAFKNFSRPLVVLNENAPRAQARRQRLDHRLEDFSPQAVRDYARGRGLFNAFIIRLIFSTVLRRRAYTEQTMTSLVAQSRFGQGEIRLDSIGFELWLHK
jgi:hypothetical protein